MLRTTILLIILAFSIAACGGATTVQQSGAQTAAPVATGFAQTGGAQTAVPIASVEVEVGGAATANPVATAEQAATARPELAPCPEPEGGAGISDCDQLYTTLLAKYGADYGKCEPTTSTAGTCTKPESLEGELKQKINIQLMLDSSGSMAADLGGQRKMDIAKDVMTTFVDTVPPEANVALRVYGHTGSNDAADRAVSCQGTELFYPFQPINAAAFKSAIAGFDATGWTPIAASLQAAQQDFAAYPGESNTNIIYLVSDGIETCDGDPVAAARALHESGVQAVVNIIGFDVDAEAANQLRAAAQAGGGQYFEARNANELNEVFASKIDWKAWNEYYGCVFRNANQQIGDTNREQNEAVACVTQTANEEFKTIFDDLNANFEQYGDCYNPVGDRFQARYKELTSASLENYQDVVGKAREEYDQAIQQLDQDQSPLQSTPTPKP